MFRTLSLIFLLAFAGSTIAAQPTGFKSGISISLGGTEGADWKSEAPYFEPQIHDIATIYLKDATPIALAHNARNVATVSNSRNLTVIGVNGLDGVADTGDEGQIRAVIDEMWSRRKWNEVFYANYLDAATDTVNINVNHGQSANTAVTFPILVNTTSGINKTTIYYLRDVAARSFKLSLTPGGAVVDITANMSGNNYASFAGGKYPLYSGPFTLAGQTYSNGQTVVGSTGGNGQTITSKSTFFYRGILDAAGDEWHVLRYADDDAGTGGASDSSASDGKYSLLVVNPKTPCLTVSATSTGQFYTSPAWTYYIPEIHAQTTYLTANTTLTLTDLYAANISYRIDGGSWVTGAGPVSIASSAFTTGTHSLEYKSIRGTEPVKTRTIVKNPTHPSLGETHGNFLWGGAGNWSGVLAKTARSPFASTYNSYLTKAGAGHDLLEAYGGQGYRLGTRRTIANLGLNANNATNFPHKNAFVAKAVGWTASPAGSSYTYGQAAKRMMLDGITSIPCMGIEVAEFAASNHPALDLWYRGYWDAEPARDSMIAYDLIAAQYRDDQQTGGLTAIEDYYFRDQMAGVVHWNLLQIAGHSSSSYSASISGGGSGMWDSPWKVVCATISTLMPSYSTPYYGTSGMDGSTTTYPWRPFRTAQYTWKQVFVTNAITKGLYPDAPLNKLGLVDDSADPLIDTLGRFVDKTDYMAYAQVGQWLGAYWNYSFLVPGMESMTSLSSYANALTSAPGAYGKKAPTGPTRLHGVTFLNDRHPTASANGNAYIQSLASGDANSDDTAIADAGIYGFAWYDDTYYGGAVAPTAPDAPTTFVTTAAGTAAISVTWVDASSNETYFEIQRSLDSAAWATVLTPAANAVSATDTGLVPSTLYYYRMRAGNATGVSAWTATSTTTTAAAPALGGRSPASGAARMIGP